MTITEFLANYVDGYIFRDLEEMEKIDVNGNGSCGYPMVMMTMSTMELLGALTHGEDFNPERSQRYFSYYWRNFFKSSSPKYQGKGDPTELLYKLVRNGLAHGPLLKHGINISKRTKAKEHFVFRPGELTIDCIQFWHDLRLSYQTGVGPIVEGAPREIEGHLISRDSMEARLQWMGETYQREAENCFGAKVIRKRTVPAQIPETEWIVGQATGSMNFAGTVSIGTLRREE